MAGGVYGAPHLGDIRYASRRGFAVNYAHRLDEALAVFR